MTISVRVWRDRLPELDDPHPARPAPPPGELVPDADPDLFWSLCFALEHPERVSSLVLVGEPAGSAGQSAPPSVSRESA